MEVDGWQTRKPSETPAVELAKATVGLRRIDDNSESTAGRKVLLGDWKRDDST